MKKIFMFAMSLVPIFLSGSAYSGNADEPMTSMRREEIKEIRIVLNESDVFQIMKGIKLGSEKTAPSSADTSEKTSPSPAKTPEKSPRSTNSVGSASSIEKAEIKGVRMGMKEADVIQLMKGIKLRPEKTSPSQRQYLCSKNLPVDQRCQFTLAGEKIFSAVFIFYDGILRSAILTIAPPDELEGIRKQQGAMQYVYDLHLRIRDAFVEKYGAPAQDRPHTYTPGSIGESRGDKVYDNHNVWIFGKDQIVIGLHQEAYKIDIEFFDKQWQNEQKQKAAQEKQIREEANKRNDLTKRKNDL